MDQAQTALKVHIFTLGCQMNQYDSARLAGILAAGGYEPAEDPAQADLILINTCSVRELAAHKAYSLLGSLKELKQQRPGLVIGVGGCLAQQEGRRMLKAVDHLDLVFGTGALDEVPRLVDQARQGRRVVHTPEADQASLPLVAPAQAPGLKAMVTVMQGCDNFCAYCVVPMVRGRERSRPAWEVLAEVASLVQAGVREVTLLGQNVNSYRDPDSGADFATLLGQVAGVEGLERVRFTTSHPKDLSPTLIQAMADLPQVMRGLHLPAQSGSDSVLGAMGRGYTRAAYLEKVRLLRAAMPDLALGGDLIVGFPGETEEDFAQSLSLIQEAGYDYLYSFKYSDRPGTRASRMADKVPEEVKSERLNRLQELQRDISLAVHQGLEGTLAQVLVEGPDKKGSGLCSGRDCGGRAVNFAGPPSLAGSLVTVEITQGRVNSLMGRLLGPARGAQT